jgi:Flp pilus assembly protein TadD
MTDWKEAYLRGMTLFGKGQHAEAVAAYREALSEDPDQLDVLHALAVALMNAGDLEEAAKVGLRIVELDPEDPFAHTSLSMIYQRQGRIDDAEAESAKARLKSWKQELKQNPEAPPPDGLDINVIQ